MLHFLDNRPGEKYAWHDDPPPPLTTPKIWQTFPGHFLKKYEKYLKKDSSKSILASETKSKSRYDDRFVDNKDLTATVTEYRNVQMTFEKVALHKENRMKKKAKVKTTEPPPRGLSALASFPVSWHCLVGSYVIDKHRYWREIMEPFFQIFFPSAGKWKYMVAIFAPASDGNIYGQRLQGLRFIEKWLSGRKYLQFICAGCENARGRTVLLCYNSQFITNIRLYDRLSVHIRVYVQS